jgi:hypothetical protein
MAAANLMMLRMIAPGGAASMVPAVRLAALQVTGNVLERFGMTSWRRVT